MHEGQQKYIILYIFLVQSDTSNFFKWSYSIILVGPSEMNSFFVVVNLGKLKLFYQFQTLHGDSCGS